jgi:DNA-binding XRE family transcriptional regulator
MFGGGLTRSSRCLSDIALDGVSRPDTGRYLKYYASGSRKSIPEVFTRRRPLNDSEMTSEHVRAARMLLRWEQKNLAKRSGVSLPTIKRLEAKPGPLGAYASTLAAIRTAFEDEGIEFFNAEAPGVRLHRRPKRLRQSRRA